MTTRWHQTIWHLTIVIAICSMAVAAGIALYAGRDSGSVDRAIVRISPSPAGPADGDGGACVLISAALDRPGQDAPIPEEVATAAAAAEVAPDPRIATLGGMLAIRAEMAIKARYAPDGPTRLGELATAAAELRLACVQGLYS